MENMIFQGIGTGAIYGVLREIVLLKERFASPDTEIAVVFCFDGKNPDRKAYYPAYKANRIREGKECLHGKSREEIIAQVRKANRIREGKENLYRQMDELQNDVLPNCGFRNIFCEEGYEADDLLAFFASRIKDHVVLVSEDHNLHQCITQDNRVIVYEPRTKSSYTWERFCTVWHGKITPNQYSMLLALTGCKTDNIEGIKRVGPETALKIINNQPISKLSAGRYKEFAASGKLEQNLKIIRLPWPGLKDVKFLPDDVNIEKWQKVCNHYGLGSLISKCALLHPNVEAGDCSLSMSAIES
jgi:5'-3' exonuclease